MVTTTVGGRPLEAGARRIDDAAANEAAAGGAASSRSPSAASWPAIFAGAVVAVAATLILLTIGSGLGFAELSPWPEHGASPTTFTVTAAIWLIVTQWLSAALGGYIAGRLRTRWVGTHTHEVFFRDTAHGLITWSVASLAVATLLVGVGGAVVGHGLRAAADSVRLGAGALAAPGSSGLASPVPGSGSITATPGPSAPLIYGIDRLFRPAALPPSTRALDALGDPRFEAAHIVGNALATGSMPESDRAYLAELVAAHTGLSGAEAQRRVDDFIAAARAAQNEARTAADAARKAAAETALYTALSMLIGAFIASVSAALGGRLRDLQP
jgi:hypothetical protein